MDPEPSEDGRVLRAQAMREGRRAQILTAAARVFSRQGFEGGSIADIIDEAKIARGTFYLHFDSKQQIFSELVDELIEAIEAVVTRVEVGAEVSPEEQLLQNLGRAFEVLEARAAVARILLAGHPRGEGVEARVVRFYDQLQALITSSLETGFEIGILRPSVDPKVVAPAMLGALKETARQLLGARGSKKKVDRRKLAESILDFCLRGVLNSP